MNIRITLIAAMTVIAMPSATGRSVLYRSA